MRPTSLTSFFKDSSFLDPCKDLIGQSDIQEAPKSETTKGKEINSSQQLFRTTKTDINYCQIEEDKKDGLNRI